MRPFCYDASAYSVVVTCTRCGARLVTGTRDDASRTAAMHDRLYHNG